MLHARLLLRRLRLLTQDLLHLSMSRHVLMHAPVHAGSLADAQVRLLEQRDALAEALLRHPAATQGPRLSAVAAVWLGVSAVAAARLGVGTHLLNMSVIASSSCCCAACIGRTQPGCAGQRAQVAGWSGETLGRRFYPPRTRYLKHCPRPSVARDTDARSCCVRGGP